MSKGSNRRPMQIPPEDFDQRWAETFGGDGKKSASYAFAMLREQWLRAGDSVHFVGREWDDC